MINTIKEWWNRDKNEIARLRKEVSDANQCFSNVQQGLFEQLAANKDLSATLQEKLAELEKVKKDLEELKAEHPDMKADGVVDPWMIVSVNGQHAVKGLKVSIDWNDAMIEHMKDKGHAGRDENVTMQHFMVQLYEHVIQILEYKSIEESEFNRENEFE